MAASRMISRLSHLDISSSQPSTPHPLSASSSYSSSTPLIVLNDSPVLASSPAPAHPGAVYRSVRSACGHVARHLPNLWKMGQYYLEGRFDPRNYGAGDRRKEEEQAHPQQDKEKVNVFF